MTLITRLKRLAKLSTTLNTARDAGDWGRMLSERARLSYIAQAREHAIALVDATRVSKDEWAAIVARKQAALLSRYTHED